MADLRNEATAAALDALSDERTLDRLAVKLAALALRRKLSHSPSVTKAGAAHARGESAAHLSFWGVSSL